MSRNNKRSKKTKKKEFDYDGFNHLIEPDGPKSAFRPMKNRFFDQNFAPPTLSEDKQYKAYQLVMTKEEDFENITKILSFSDIEDEFDPHVLKFIEETFIVSCDWERFERDMINLSYKAKTALIRVFHWCEDVPRFEDLILKGALDDDLSKSDSGMYLSFFKNGRHYTQEISMNIPEFDYMEMKK